MDNAEVLEPIKDLLDEFEGRFYKELGSEHSGINDLVSHVSKFKGKRLRPALLLLSAKCVGNCLPQHMDLAIVVEMIHTATLVHDDIIDEATVRRHVPSMNIEWGREISILFGDYLFSRGFTILSSLDSQLATLLLSQTVNILCEGELIQLEKRYNKNISESDYMRIIEMKTASLCASSCRLGAHFAGANKDSTESFTRFGLKLGTAFQIIDDCLDIIGNENEMGKTLNTDTKKGKLTLPLIKLMDSLPENRKDDTCKLIYNNQDGDSNSAVLELLTEHDAIEYSYSVARNLVDEALNEISFVPDSIYKTALFNIANYVVTRKT
ncbi:MAG: polyprenyl synthetase family protein [Candidatus Anammoxibacter sp.]